MDTLVLAARVALSLAVVLGVLWFLQRRVSRSSRVRRAASAVSVVTRQGISPKASVVVVDVEGTRYLLGVTEQSITLLSSGDAPAAPAALSAVPVPVPVATPAAAAASVLPLLAPGAESSSAGAFAKALHAENDVTVAPVAGDSALRRPRDRASRSRIASAAPPADGSPLAGSILSGATWRQAASALRQRRAG